MQRWPNVTIDEQGPIVTVALGTLFLIGHLLSLVVIALAAYLIGARIMRAVEHSCPIGEIAVSITLGLGAIAFGIMLLGLLRALYLPVVLASLVVTMMLCLGDAERALTRVRNVFASRSGQRRIWLLAMALIGLPVLLLALYPPAQFDETLYHLPYAKSFIEQGRLSFIPSLRFPVFPQLIEMLFTLGMLLTGDIVARLTQTMALLLVALLLYAWGRSRFSERTGLLAAALWLGNPIAIRIGTGAYIDIGLTLFVTAALFAWERWRQTDQRQWLWLAGCFAGCAAASKYLGLFFVAAVVLMTAIDGCKRRRLAPLLQLCVIAGLVLMPWYGRIIYHTGSPLFPFYPALFGASEWSPELAPQGTEAGAVEPPETAVELIREQAVRLTRSIGDLILVPWRAVFDRAVFNWQAPLSPFYLILIPLLGPIALASPRSRRYLALAGAYGLLWLTTIQDLRFLLPVLPLLSLALATALDRAIVTLCHRLPRLDLSSRSLVSVVIIATLLAPGPLYAGYKIYEQGPLPVSREQRSSYLAKQVTGYSAIALLNQTRGSDYTVYTLWGEHLAYYADGRFLGDIFGPNRISRISPLLRNSRALHGKLRSLGVDHLLILRHRRPVKLPTDRFFLQHFQTIAEDEDFILLVLQSDPS
jgi:4-amino-4-deoxy-L-arabinose transferase-like glycosyltransferase